MTRYQVPNEWDVFCFVYIFITPSSINYLRTIFYYYYYILLLYFIFILLFYFSLFCPELHSYFIYFSFFIKYKNQFFVFTRFKMNKIHREFTEKKHGAQKFILRYLI